MLHEKMAVGLFHFQLDHPYHLTLIKEKKTVGLIGNTDFFAVRNFLSLLFLLALLFVELALLLGGGVLILLVL